MSTFIAGFDGRICCNCGSDRDLHQADGSCHCRRCGRIRSEHAPDGACPTPAAAGQMLDRLDARGLASCLSSLIEHGAWAYAPDPSGDMRCRACGFLAGYAHHPACAYWGLAERIKAL